MAIAKQIGNAGESLVARRMTKWTGVKYKRRTGSGASDNHDYRVRGDVAPLFPSPYTIFNLEVKTRSTKKISELTYSTFQEGYTQSVRDAMTYRIPLVLIVDKNKQIFMLIDDLWLSRIIKITGNTSLLNIRYSYSKRYKQSLVPFETFIEKVSYYTLQENREALNLERIEDLQTALEFAIGLDKPYDYQIMTVPEFVNYYNKSYPKRKQIKRDHVYDAINRNLIHGFILTNKHGRKHRLVVLTERTAKHIFRYKSPKNK